MIFEKIPEITSPYFTLEAGGGYYRGLKGKVQVSANSGLNNCVCAAWGLFAMNENDPNCIVGGTQAGKPANAQEWIKYHGKYETGKEPREGAIIVYGGTGTAGHVAFVNSINSDGTLQLIESGYGRTNKAGLWFRTVSPSNNYFISNTAGNFLGFIYPSKTAQIKPNTDTTVNTATDLQSVVNDVLAGKYGNYPARKTNLEKAGYDYSEIQRLVNARLNHSNRIETVAREVIRGIWGNGSYRKTALEKAGYDYTEVQNKVNELLKK